MRKISIMTLLLVLTMVFAGCTSEEMKLYDAFEKSKEITSMESDTNLSFTLDATNLSAEEQQDMEEVKRLLKDSKITVHQKSLQNKERTIVKSQVDTVLNLGGMAMDMQIWIDTDMSSSTPKFVEIIKMPPIFMMSAPPEYANKEYMVYDFGEMMNEDQSVDMNFNELMNFSKEMQPKMTNFLKDNIAKLDLGFNVVEYKGKKTVDGKSLAIYEVKLDDASLKKLLRYSGNYFIEDKNTMEFMREYMKAVANVTKPTDMDEESAQEEINQELDKLQNDIPKLKEQFNKFMDTFEGVKILGDKGIVIEYSVNEEGYIVHENGMIDLSIDLGALKKLSENIDTENIDTNENNTSTQETDLFQIGINFNTDIYNINNDIEVQMPQVNEENSLNFKDLMESNE
ncbi:MAG: hypothetical protein ACOYVK_19035 [Bacillota bacterium]